MELYQAVNRHKVEKAFGLNSYVCKMKVFCLKTFQRVRVRETDFYMLEPWV